MQKLLCGVLCLLALAALSAELTGRIQTLERLTPVIAKPSMVHHVPKAAARPVIDGAADEWAGVPAMVLDNKDQARGWNGPDDLHGAMKLLWNEEGLFFCLEVADDVHSAPNADRDWWENDGCQFAFDAYMNGPSGGYDADEQSYMVCDSPDGTRFIVYRQAGSPSEVALRLPERAVGMREGADHTRTFEWMMPWEQLAPVSPWLLGRCGYTFTLNDNDGRGFKGAMFWTKGLIYGQDAAQFGQLVFDGAAGLRPAMLGLPPEEQVTDTQHDSAWLPTAGVLPWDAARLLVQVPGGGPVEGSATLYRAGEAKPLTTGALAGDASKDAPLLLAWNLGTLPAGQYEIEYAVTRPALGSRRIAFTHYDLAYLRDRRPWLRETFALDRPWDPLPAATPLVRRHRGLAALALSLMADVSWTNPMSNVDERDEHLKALAYCGEMIRALEAGKDFLATRRDCFWSAYFSPADGSGQSFVVTLPPKFNPHKTYPLLVSLHGAGGVPVVRPAMTDRPEVITVQPWGRGATSGYRDLSEDDVLRVIAEMTAWYRIDPDRVYLSGGSMGGGGTWWFASRHPDLFAAAAPVCGYAESVPLENLRHVPVFNQHGAKDWSVPIDFSRYAVATLQRNGYPLLHKEFSEAGHSIGGALNTTPWLRSHRRVIQPAEVTFTCTRPDAPYNRAYWVTVRELADPHLPARVQATVVGRGAQQGVTLVPDNTAVLELDLTRMPLDRKAGLLLQIGNSFRDYPKPLPERLFLVRRDAEWTVTDTWQPAATPQRPYRAGAEANLYTGEPLMIVYPTQCPETRKALWQGVADKLSHYAAGRGEPMPAGHFLVKADADVTADDMRHYNLLLVGGLAENRLTAAMLPQLPFTVNAKGELVAGNRPPMSLAGAMLFLHYINPKAPGRLIYLIATDDDGTKLRERLTNPQYLLSGVWSEMLGNVPDLRVETLDGTARRQMQFTHGWQWREYPGADRPLPLAAYDGDANSRATARALRKAAGADFAFCWDTPEDQETPITTQPMLTYADQAVYRSPVETITGMLTGEDLRQILQTSLKQQELLCEPAFTAETVDPKRRYRIVMPLGALWNANAYQRNMQQTAPGPFVSQDEILAELERLP